MPGDRRGRSGTEGDAVGPSLPDEVPTSVAGWFDEAPPRRGTGLPPREVVEGLGFAIWGALLVAVLLFSLVVGGISGEWAGGWPTTALLWVLSMALAGAGGWLAFWLASELGWGVSTEWKP